MMSPTATPCFDVSEYVYAIPGEERVVWLAAFENGQTHTFNFPLYPVVKNPVEVVTP